MILRYFTCLELPARVDNIKGHFNGHIYKGILEIFNNLNFPYKQQFHKAYVFQNCNIMQACFSKLFQLIENVISD